MGRHREEDDVTTRPRPHEDQPGPEARDAGGARTRRGGALASLSAALPVVAERYRALADAAAEAGPLDARSVALAKFAVSVGRGSSRAVHAHARKALEVGVDRRELTHVVALSLPTIGLHAALDAWRWLEEIVTEADSRTGVPPSIP